MSRRIDQLPSRGRTESAAEGRVRIIVFSPSGAVLEGLASILNNQVAGRPSLSVIARMRDDRTVTRNVRELCPDVTLLHGLNPEHVARLSRAYASRVLWAVDEPREGLEIVHALRAGVTGIVSIDSDLAALAQACREVAIGRPYLSPSLVGTLIDQIAGRQRHKVENRFNLTAREAQVLRYLASGKAQAEIADVMRITVRTVKHHLCNTYRKLDARDRADAIVLAYREGLVS